MPDRHRNSNVDFVIGYISTSVAVTIPEAPLIF
jgi:hypothetical protein